MPNLQISCTWEQSTQASGPGPGQAFPRLEVGRRISLGFTLVSSCWITDDGSDQRRGKWVAMILKPPQYSLPTMLTKESISYKCYKECLGSQAGPSEVRWTQSAAGTVLLIPGWLPIWKPTPVLTVLVSSVMVKWICRRSWEPAS